MKLLASASIFLAAFLLFALEPLIAKRILPWFGGSSAVWSVCLVFYQLALLAGYAYARTITRHLKQIHQVVVHVFLLTTALLLLPIGPTSRWKPDAAQHPSWQILAMLSTTIGLPFLLLSATSPLLQHWLAQSGEDKPYRLFAWSNFASLSALLAYPLFVEPHLNSTQQSFWWSAAFTFFAILCVMFAWTTRSAAARTAQPIASISISTKALWFSLSACGSMLLLSITNHIDENVAAVPLLWVLPLAVYLISFIFAFASNRFHQRAVWLRLLAFGLAMLAYAAYDITAVLPLQVSVPVFLAGLFIACYFCHSELYRLRPEVPSLTDFYLWIAVGGAAGAVFVGLIAPQLFGGIYELPYTMMLTAALALVLTWQSGDWGARFLWIGVTASMVVVLILSYRAFHQNALALERSFYGSLRVLQTKEPGPEQVRTLFHGTVQHGDQFQWPSRKMSATTYYGPSSGIGILLREWPSPAKRVGVVGLGAGTLAAYGQPGDTFRFYEINPQVVELAGKYFSFMRESQAHIEVVDGDARLSLDREHIPPFDVLVFDAFSGDAIPVHLLTKEAMNLYATRLRPGGVMAFHISNNYLDLAPVVKSLADSIGYRCLVVTDSADDENMVLASEWVLASKDEAVLLAGDLGRRSEKVKGRKELRMWTDQFNSLLEILKTPEIRQ